MGRLLCAMLTFCGVVFAQSGGICPAAVAESLIAVDRQFAADVDAQGFPGWMKYFADDATGLAPDDAPLPNKTALTAFYTAMFEKPESLPRWSPLRADCSADGTLGFTYGTWRSRSVSGPQGQYITIWRRQKAGEWKAIFDLGNFRPAAR